jgi:ankyrin repeat protein
VGMPLFSFFNLKRKHDQIFILATSSGYYDVVVLLLKAGANPNLKDKRGRTPFILGNN